MNGVFYKGKKIADKGYLINLPHRVDRLNESTKILNELGFSGYEIFEGVVIEEKEYKKLGCTASYLKIFEEIINSGYEDVLVFEDDIKLMKGTTKKDLDNIFDDWSEIKKRYDIVALGTKLLPRSRISVNGKTHGSYQEMLCTQSFYYKKEIIQHTLKELSTYKDSKSYLHKCTIDMFLNDCSSEKYRFIHSNRHRTFQFGITIPMIFSQTESFSDNEEVTQNYEEEMYGSFFKSLREDKGYVLYATENYVKIVTECAKSIREFSKLPIYVYLINSNQKIEVENTKTIRWELDMESITEENYIKTGDNFYIERKSPLIYKILAQRPVIVKNVLENYLNTVCYVDCDSVATPFVDKIFSFYDNDSEHPFFVEGIYNYLKLNGRGGGPDFGGTFEDTLEYDSCKLFGVDQTVRKIYRQTGYFISGQKTLDFLDEWSWMCNHPSVLKNCEKYAPFNEETIANVLLWKYNIQKGLPYIYVNGNLDTIQKMYYEVEYKGPEINNFIGEWLRAPQDKEHLLFFHGEKNPEKMKEMVSSIKKIHDKKLKVLFLAPHLSTGGMPSFLLKRIESLLKFHPEIDLYVVEYCLYATNYVVQRNKIKELIPKNKFWTLNTLNDHSESNTIKLIEILKNNSIDILHIDEIPEGFDSFNKVYDKLLDSVFKHDRTWKVVETCHNVWFDQNNLNYIPDGFAFCTPYHNEIQFKDISTKKQILEFPIENKLIDDEHKKRYQDILGLDKTKVHVLNVGLWTSGKNQGEGVEIAKLCEKTNPNIHFHFVGNQASNFESYWSPIMQDLPSNVTVWGERDDVENFMKASDVFMFNSTHECNPIVLREAVSFGLKILARNLPQYFEMFKPYITEIKGSVEHIKSDLLELINKEIKYNVPNNNLQKFADAHVQFYENLKNSNIIPQTKKLNNISVTQFFIEQPFFEIKGKSNSIFKVQYFDENNVLHYENSIPCNSWVRLNRQYFTNWRTKVYENDVLILDQSLNYEGKRVFISFGSKSLGDSIAWIPYCLEFKNKHKCDLIVSTFWNNLFQDVYPEIEFVTPGGVIHNIHGMYKLGWFWDSYKEPELPNTIPLQKTATNILGLDYKEIIPKIKFEAGPKPIEGEYITIATNSTAGCKFWTREGWQELINYFDSIGYKVVNVSKEENPFNKQIRLKDLSIENTMNVIHHSKFFVGLSSGLSWLAWGLGKHVVMISNFTKSDHEFQSNCTRITNDLVCNGCWNNTKFTFDKGDWNWCPVHKGTERQFECHKSITSEMLINKIQKLLK